MISNYNKISKKVQNFKKSRHLKESIFNIQQWLIKKCDILRQLYIFLIIKLKNSLKNSFIWKSETQTKKQFIVLL